MKTYHITVRETLLRSFEIEADSPEQAEALLFADYPWSDEAPDIITESIEEA